MSYIDTCLKKQKQQTFLVFNFNFAIFKFYSKFQTLPQFIDVDNTVLNQQQTSRN